MTIAICVGHSKTDEARAARGDVRPSVTIPGLKSQFPAAIANAAKFGRI